MRRRNKKREQSKKKKKNVHIGTFIYGPKGFIHVSTPMIFVLLCAILFVSRILYFVMILYTYRFFLLSFAINERLFFFKYIRSRKGNLIDVDSKLYTFVYGIIFWRRNTTYVKSIISRRTNYFWCSPRKKITETII